MAKLIKDTLKVVFLARVHSVSTEFAKSETETPDKIKAKVKFKTRLWNCDTKRKGET